MKNSSMKNRCPDLKPSRLALTLAALSFSAAVLIGCHGEARFNHDPDPAPDPEQPGELIIAGGDYISGQPYLVTLKNAADLRAKIGTLSKINPVTGEEAGEFEWFYTVPFQYFTGYEIDYKRLRTVKEQFTAQGIHGDEFVYGRELRPTDSYLADHWHIYNIGQNPYGMVNPPLKKIDMNVIPAWRTVHNGKLLSGEGVNVAVLDTPVDINHEDLRDRIYTPVGQIPGSDAYVNTGISLEVTKLSPLILTHGTMVAGIIAASGGNEKGGRGIAYNANITALAGLMPDPFESEDTSVFLSYVIKAGGFSLVSNSMGADFDPKDDPATYELFDELYEQDIAFIHSMGNEFMDKGGEAGSAKEYYMDTCILLNVNCEFKQTDERSRHPYVINVGSLDSLGVHASYSSTGSNIWISATGGYKGYRSGSDVISAGIVTTMSSYGWDETGYDKEAGAPWMDSGDKQYYTQTMTGTSAATPMISGISALAYQAKPDMTVSQLRYLLAKTARNDRTVTTLRLEAKQSENDLIYNRPMVYDYGWQDNAAGMRFSSYYGFGLADAAALVDAAAGCSDDPVCAAMARPAEAYTSSNESPCRYDEVVPGTEDQIGETNIVCTFNGFRNRDNPDETLTDEPLTIDAVSFNFFGFAYDADNQVYCKCRKLASDAAEEQMEGVTYANAVLQIEMISPSDTVSLVKPLYANWGYVNILNGGAGNHNGGYSENFQLSTSSFYLEKFRDDPEKPFTIRFKTGCSVDLDNLNKYIDVTVYGRK
jgi:subtilisin family serine protease